MTDHAIDLENGVFNFLAPVLSAECLVGGCATGFGQLIRSA